MKKCDEKLIVFWILIEFAEMKTQLDRERAEVLNQNYVLNHIFVIIEWNMQETLLKD